MSHLFEPVPASGKKLAASTSTGSVMVTNQASGMVQLAVYNSGTVGVLVDFGDENITVTNTTGHAVPAGQMRGFTISRPGQIGGPKGVHMAAITLSSTADVYVSVGHGI